MPWFRVDDQFWQHPKVLGIPPRYRNDAAGLWVRAGSYCAMNLTDGYIAPHARALLDGGKNTIARLELAGLWVPAPDGAGWYIHDWAAWQPTRAQLQERREADRKRKRQERETDG